MCGRYALGISIENLPEQFNETVLNQNQNNSLIEQSRQENSTDSAQETHHETTASVGDAVQSIQLNVSTHGFEASYNIPPTGTGVIIYMEKRDKSSDIEKNESRNAKDGSSHDTEDTYHTSSQSKKYAYSYRIEPSKFGLLPVWAKPQDSSRVKKSSGNATGAKYSREVQQHQAKLFNCRKETLAHTRTVWATSRKHTRCVVPISGFFEWQNTNTKQGKVPHYVYSRESPIIFLAGLYAHNYNYNSTEMVPKNAKYFSSFSIVTGPATGKGKNDMSWLHSRKPIFIEPNSKAWYDWLQPDDHWDEELLETCLNTETNPVYESLAWHVVAKEVGNPANKGADVIKEEKAKQSSISSFFSPRKVKNEVKEEAKEKVKEESKEEVKEESKEEAKQENTSGAKKEKREKHVRNTNAEESPKRKRSDFTEAESKRVKQEKHR